MASLRPPVSRLTFIRGAPDLRSSQRRWAQVHDVRFLATHSEPNRVIDKYRDKLDRKVKEEGLKDVDELKEVYKEKIQSLRRTASIAPTASTSPFSAPPPPPKQSEPEPESEPKTTAETTSAPEPSKPLPSIKPLSAILNLPKALLLPPTEISYLWRLRHASNPNSLSATIPSETYAIIASTAQKHPHFILPLPRPGRGAEIHFLQWTFPTPNTSTVLFTHLAEYKLRGEYAQPHTTVTHHLDMSEEKGIVLLQGNVVEGRGVSVEEGKWLLMCLQKFYGSVGLDAGEKERRRRLLEMFSEGHGDFRVEELVEEAEKIT
ncbi:MAG: hypothetical protein M1835_007446 [Candelina submexicana]|nr:MAG: hypothetical protein M1835_007446 [Candelina submexicana]